jgi:tol-pal system protein YbgF
MNVRNLPIALLVAGTLLSGCAGGKANAPRAGAQDPAARDVSALRQENEALKQEQMQNARQLEAMQKQMAAEREEQRRFREMMATNFDLLEQSVALTLSKSVERSVGGSGQPAAKPPTPAPKAAVAAKPVTAAKPAHSKTSATVAHPASVQPAKAEPLSEALEGEDVAPAPTRPASAPSARAVPAGPAATSLTGSRPAVQPAAKAAALTAVAAATPNAAPEDPDLTPPAQPKQLTANRAAKALYDRGFALYAAQQYESAILAYESFLMRYPADIYSDNAQFWIAEANLRMDKLPDAETAYRKVLREYEHKTSLEGFKTPEAIYRLGVIAKKRGNARQAQAYFQNVALRFPESSAGRQAQRELDGGPASTAQTGAKPPPLAANAGG